MWRPWVINCWGLLELHGYHGNGIVLEHIRNLKVDWGNLPVLNPSHLALVS